MRTEARTDLPPEIARQERQPVYHPDFIVQVDDGHGEDVPNVVVEIRGYRREDAKEKKSTMETYWVPGVDHLGTQGRWGFAELTEIYKIESELEARVRQAFEPMVEEAAGRVLTEAQTGAFE